MNPAIPAAPGRRLALVAAGLLLLNPLTYAMHRVVGGLYPDSLAYLAFSRELLRTGQLYLAGWGHVDSGLILPPLYPALSAALGSLNGDVMAASYAISTAAALLALAPLLLLARQLGGLVFGACALLVAQVHPVFLQYGTATLTESLFLLLLAGASWAALRYLARPSAAAAFGLGVLAALLFLTRQIGGFLWPVLAALALLAGWRDRLARRGVTHALLLTAGFALLAGPYAATLRAQTGHWPTEQSFRLQRYTVVATEAASATPPGNDYEALFARRREDRRLLPDASEMIAATVRPHAGGTHLPPLGANLAANLGHLARSLGVPGLALFLLSLLTPAIGARRTALEPWLLPAVLGGYLCALSLFSGAIARYVEIVVPLALVQVFAEAQRLAGRALERRWPRTQPLAVAGALAAVLVASLPATFASLATGPRIGEADNPLGSCREHLAPSAPVFAFHPFGAYLLGATWRVVPNEELGQVLRYAGRTGVRHLVLLQIPPDLDERSYYTHAPWLLDPEALTRADVTPVCATSDGVAILYRLPPEP